MDFIILFNKSSNLFKRVSYPGNHVPGKILSMETIEGVYGYVLVRDSMNVTLIDTVHGFSYKLMITNLETSDTMNQLACTVEDGRLTIFVIQFVR